MTLSEDYALKTVFNFETLMRSKGTVTKKDR